MFSFSKTHPETHMMFIVAVVMILLAIIPSSSASYFNKHIHAHILNELSPNNVLYVRCKCSDHDLGDHYVNVGSEFEWQFKEHVFRKTVWSCYLAPDNNRHVDYRAYYDDFQGYYLDKQNNVYWIAKDDGLYVRIFSGKTRDEFYQAWDKN
ncbi:S-protein homolog 74 [Linum perenne]